MATLRRKTREKLSEDMCRILEVEIINFLGQNAEDAQNKIWGLAYRREEELKCMGFPEDISEEDTRVIRSELASQYRTTHKEWKYGLMYQGHEMAKTEEARKLKEAINEDMYVFDTIMERLLEFSYRHIYTVEKVLRCLRSWNEKSQFGGLKALEFNNEEADYLRPFANLMGDLYKKMVDDRRGLNEELPFFFGEERKVPVTEVEDETEEDENTSAEENGSENLHNEEEQKEDVRLLEQKLFEEKKEAMAQIKSEEEKRETIALNLIKSIQNITIFYAAYHAVEKDFDPKWLIEHEKQVIAFMNKYDELYQ